MSWVAQAALMQMEPTDRKVQTGDVLRWYAPEIQFLL